MKVNQFKIFKPSNRIVLSTNTLVYSSLVFFCFAWYLLDRYSARQLFVSFVGVAIMLNVVVLILLKLTHKTTKRKLHGILDGLFEMQLGKIIIEDREILLDDISKIEFKVNDYDNKLIIQHFDRHVNINVNPRISNGTSNYCELRLKSKEVVKVMFLQCNENDFIKNQPILIEYYIQGKLHFLHLIEVLHLRKYEEIQEFKTTLPRLIEY
jgi:hypothetical protein